MNVYAINTQKKRVDIIVCFSCVAYGDNHVKAVYFCWTVFVLSIMQKMHITSFLQFPFFKRIVYMTCNNRLVFLEQFSHLSLS